MPRYDYQCAACGQRFEVRHGVHEDGPVICALCGAGPIRKAFAPPVIHFKGSGWAKKDRRPAAAAAAATTADADASPAPADASPAPAATGSTETPKAAKDAVAPAAGAAD